MSDLFLKLSQTGSRQWIVDADISGCFDNISHCHIEQTLQKWYVQSNLTKTIHQMLEAKIFYDGQIVDNESGTPQGGVVSPLLANVALTAKVKAFLWENIGLELSDDKTRITHIDEGFDFLGFNFRKYQTRGKKILLIKPQKSNISGVKKKIKDAIRSCRGSSQRVVIDKLNPIINGWGNYYRHVVSKKYNTPQKLDSMLRWINTGKNERLSIPQRRREHRGLAERKKRKQHMRGILAADESHLSEILANSASQR